MTFFLMMLHVIIPNNRNQSRSNVIQINLPPKTIQWLIKSMISNVLVNHSFNMTKESSS